MSQDVIKALLAAIRDSIARIEAAAGNERSRALTLALAHLWSAYDELELSRRDVAAAS